MRWCVRALGHVAQVAHEALVHHFPVVLLVHTIDFHGAAFVHQVKQRGERPAQAHTTAATMADVEDALHLVKGGFFVVVVRTFPVNGVAGGC